MRIERGLLLLGSLALGSGVAFAQQRGTSRGPNNDPSVESGFPGAPFFTHTGLGADFIQASTNTRTAGLASPPQVCPFTLNVPAPPAGSNIVDVLISWTYLSNDAPPTDDILVNGMPVTGAQLGFGTPDLCWGRTFAVTYLTAGASGIVNVGGANTFDSVCDGPVGSDPNALGEGITVFVVYDDPASGTTQVVDIFAGYTSSQSSATGTALANLELSCSYNGGPVHFAVNADDGQQAGDLFFINDIDVSGLVAGTAVAGDAWQGLSGPAPINNLYDIADDDIATWMTAGDTVIKIESGFGGDCVAHSVAAAAYEGDPACNPCTNNKFCNPFTGSFDNTATIGADTCDLAGSVVLDLGSAEPNQSAYLVMGNGTSLITDPPGALGDLCVVGGSCFGRYAKDVGTTDGSGAFSTDISNTNTGGPNYGIPLCGGNIMPGETWYFQFWYRRPSNPVSGLSEAICITFQ